MSFEAGLKRIIGETIIGLFAASLISSIQDPFIRIVLNLIFIAGFVELISSMKYWGTTYIVGWLAGIILLTPSGLIDSGEIIIYVVAGVILIYSRKKRFRL